MQLTENILIVVLTACTYSLYRQLVQTVDIFSVGLMLLPLLLILPTASMYTDRVYTGQVPIKGSE